MKKRTIILGVALAIALSGMVLVRTLLDRHRVVDVWHDFASHVAATNLPQAYRCFAEDYRQQHSFETFTNYSVCQQFHRTLVLSPVERLSVNSLSGTASLVVGGDLPPLVPLGWKNGQVMITVQLEKRDDKWLLATTPVVDWR